MKASGLGLVLLACAAACAGPAAFEERTVSPTPRAPLAAQRLALPPGVRAVAAWVADEGDGVIALGDGRMFAMDVRGAVRPLALSIDRLPGEPERAGEAQVMAFGERAPESLLALVPGGALAVERGFVRRASLPAFVGAAPRAFAALGPLALWATPDGLFASRSGRWFNLEAPSGKVRDVSALVPISGAPEAWFQAGARLGRVRIEDGEPPRVTWLEAAPGVDLGAVRALARVDGTRAAVLSSRGFAVVGPDRVRLFHGAPEDGLPEALGGGGGFAWVGWAGQILRTDGERWEALAGGVALGPGASIAVDGGSGTAAVVIDANGDAFRLEAEEVLRLSGVRDGAEVMDTRLELEAIPSGSWELGRVTFAVDGKEVAVREEKPWGWGEGGARMRDVQRLSFGAHRIDVVAHSRDGEKERKRTIRIAYASPLRRVPTYDKDVAPIYAAHCARCHTGGIAHDLGSYAALAAERRMVRAAVRDARMPPDILLDPVSTAVITAWIDGDTPK